MSNSAERFDRGGESGAWLREVKLGSPRRACARRGEQQVDTLGCVCRRFRYTLWYQVDAGVGSLTR
ncbi:MAG TPA: hypothetical protein VGI66_00375 [Streptosporangiaceae bacterium]